VDDATVANDILMTVNDLFEVAKLFGYTGEVMVLMLLFPVITCGVPSLPRTSSAAFPNR
jgi:hypothetical protein